MAAERGPKSRARGAPLLFALASVACASADGPRVGSSAAAIVGGAADGADPAVVAVVHRPIACGAKTTSAVCSGALVAPRVVLTAAHCVDPIESGPFDVFAGARVGEGGWTSAVVEAAVHPRYDRDTHAFDAALLRLADAPPGVAPLAIVSGAPDPQVDDAVRAVGFGVDGTDGSFPGTKREGAMRVTGSTASTFDAAPSPAMTCAGDSGGPVFARDAAGVERLVGVTVEGDPGCRAAATNLRVDAVRDDFVAPFVAAAATATPGVPEGAVSRARLCDDACASSSDCPAAFECIEVAPSTRRCALPGGTWGTLGAPCSEAAGCGPGATCVHDPSATCTCLTPCAGAPPSPGVPPPGPDAGVTSGASASSGCAASPPRDGGGPRSSIALAVLVGCAAGRRRKRRPTRV